MKFDIHNENGNTKKNKVIYCCQADKVCNLLSHYEWALRSRPRWRESDWDDKEM